MKEIRILALVADDLETATFHIKRQGAYPLPISSLLSKLQQGLIR